MSLLDDLKNNADEIAEGYNNYRDVVERNSEVEIKIPKGTTIVNDYAFFQFRKASAVDVPEGVVDIRDWAFAYAGDDTTNENGIEYSLPTSLRTIGSATFAYARGLKAIVIPVGVATIQSYAFGNDSNLTDLSIPATLQDVAYNWLAGCVNLENVTIANGFNCNGVRFSESTKYTATTIVSWLNALADRSGKLAFTLYIGSTNLAKLTAEQIAIATNKNWNLA